VSAAHQTGSVRDTSEPRLELAAQVRRLIALTVGSRASDEDVSAAAASLEKVADGLEAATRGRQPRRHPDRFGDPQDFFPTSPVIGFASPLAPPVLIRAVGDELHGTAWFDYQYEGPPTCVHGGVIAMVFDEMLGSVNILAGFPSMTGTLTIRYRKPTPIRSPICLEARFVSRTGRRIRTWGGMYHGDELTAEADAVFVEASAQFARSIRNADLGNTDHAP